MNDIAKARETIRAAFEKDKGFKQGYISNIAMLLHDRYGITDQKTRNQAAEDLLQLIFYSGAEETDSGLMKRTSTAADHGLGE